MRTLALPFLGVLAVVVTVSVIAFRPAHADDTVSQLGETSRYDVATQVLPGNISMTILYITDHQTNKLHIYRAVGGMDTSFNKNPKLYKSFDLESAGHAELKVLD